MTYVVTCVGMMKQGALMTLLYALVHFPFCDNLIDENLEVITLKSCKSLCTNIERKITKANPC